MKRFFIIPLLALTTLAQFPLPYAIGTTIWKGFDITTGLVAYYPLNEASGNALDASGNSRTMAQTGTVGAGSGATANSRGPYTSSDYFTRTDSALNLNTADWTICGWIYFTGAPTFNVLVGQRQASNTAWNYALQVYNGGAASYYYGSVYNISGTASDVEAPGTAIASGSWHFVTTRYTSSTRLVEASIDGGSYGSATLANTAQTTLIPTQIGKWEYDTTSAGAVYLGKIRFYSGRILDSTVISYLYNGGTFSTAP